MNPLIMIAQAFLNHQTQLQGENLRQAGLRAAEAGRRMALAGVFFAIGGVFTFSALLLAVIELGRQIDASDAIRFSGLMISALILLALSLFFMLVGWMIGRNDEVKKSNSSSQHEHYRDPSPANDLQSELRTLVETVAVSLLREFMAAREKKSEAATNAATSNSSAPQQA